MLEKPTRVRLAVLAFICALSFLTYLDRICIMQVADRMQTDLGIDATLMGLVFSAFLFGYMLFEVPGGYLGDRWGSRRVLLRIVLWWSLFTALTGCVWRFSVGPQWEVGFFGFIVPLGLNSFCLLVLIRFLFGCGEAGAYPNMARVAGSWFPFGERAFAMGAIWFSARMGGAFAPLITEALTGQIGWKGAFLFLGCIGLVWVALFARWFKDRPEDMEQCNQAERDLIRAGPHSMTAEQAGHHHGEVPWGEMIRSPNMWAICLAAFCVSFGWYFYPTWQPRFLLDVHRISYKDSTILTGLPFLCGAIGCLLGGRVSDWAVRRFGSRRWGRSMIGLVGFTGAGLCVLGTGYVQEPWQAVVLLCLAFFINDIAIPVIWAVAADIGGKHAGTVAGFMNMIGALGGMISPAMTPILLEGLPADWDKVVRWQMVFAILAGAWFVAAAAWLGIDASKPLFRGDRGKE